MIGREKAVAGGARAYTTMGAVADGELVADGEEVAGEVRVTAEPLKRVSSETSNPGPCQGTGVCALPIW